MQMKYKLVKHTSIALRDMHCLLFLIFGYVIHLIIVLHASGNFMTRQAALKKKDRLLAVHDVRLLRQACAVSDHP